jgi:benzoyl-CoA-dihydrodiol lyase
VESVAPSPPPSFETSPDQYRHWKLTFDGPVATLAMDVREDAGLRPNDYKLKLNSYDLGVDIELADALQRIRFEHPEVHAVMLTSLKPRLFCAGANIFMLGSSSHVFKVNFCKFTNETRLGMEDMSARSGIRFLAAVNGICAGGGYELALACDEIHLVDDGSAAVSLPETPLLGVLPGTGGLTRVVDKRKVRRDVAASGPWTGAWWTRRGRRASSRRGSRSGRGSWRRCPTGPRPARASRWGSWRRSSSPIA